MKISLASAVTAFLVLGASAETLVPPSGYRSVEEALRAVRERPHIKITTEPTGWLLLVDEEAQTQWSFPPKSHPAHPAVVRRTIKQRRAEVDIEMSALCESSWDDCELMVTEFEQLNLQIQRTIRTWLRDSGAK